ncbi:MAG: DUF2628 domain-containing protein [Acetobacteraceae bacterium]
MRIYTAHVRAAEPPVLVREGFAWWALIFGPLWLCWNRAWIAGVIVLAVMVGIAVAPAWMRAPLGWGLMLLLGFTGNDLRRWSLARSGYALAHVVAARNGDEAFLRLLGHRPDLQELPA